MFDPTVIGGLPHPVSDRRFYDGVPLRRLIAFVIDSVATVLLGVVAGLVFGLATLGVGFLVFVPVLVATGFVYRAASIARWSATPGMLATGIELRNRDGLHLAPSEALLHTTLFAMLTVSGILQVLSAALMAMTPMGRGLHDMVLGTAAIHRPF